MTLRKATVLGTEELDTGTERVAKAATSNIVDVGDDDDDEEFIVTEDEDEAPPEAKTSIKEQLAQVQEDVVKVVTAPTVTKQAEPIIVRQVDPTTEGETRKTLSLPGRPPERDEPVTKHHEAFHDMIVRPDPEAVRIVEERRGPDLKVAPDDLVLRYNGPAQSYSVGELRFLKGQPRQVPARYVDALVETGFFSRSSLEALKESTAPGVKEEMAQYRVGDFLTKADAIAYARDVHGVTLDENKALRTLNDATFEMFRLAEEKRRLDGVEFVD